MKIRKLLLATLLIMPALAFGEAGTEGGGGGAGICKANKCITLVEAGFRVNDPNAGSTAEIGQQTLFELDDIQTKVPVPGLATANILGKHGDIVFIDIADQARVRKFMKEYESVLQNNSTTPQGKVQILAFTINDKTYLITEKFEALSTRGQALLLIHEYSLRVRKANLTQALKFDGALLDCLNAVELGSTPNAIALLNASRGMYYWPENELDGHMLAQLMARGTFNDADIFERSVINLNRTYPNITFDYRQMLELRTFIPEITKHLKPGSFPVAMHARTAVNSGFSHFLRNKIEATLTRSIIVTNDTYTDFVKNNYDANVVEALNQCGDRDDEKNIIVRPEAGVLKMLGIATCNGSNPPVHYRIKRDLGSMMNLFKDLRGLNLNLREPLKCKIWSGFVSCEGLD